MRGSGQNEPVTDPTTEPDPNTEPDGSPGERRFRVCFVCTGNICRSPMADVVLRHLATESRMADGSVLADRLAVDSAGTSGWHLGEPMDPRARAALERRGYSDHGHLARSFDTAWFDSTDLVVCMDRGHQQTLVSLARGRTGDDRHDGRLVMLRRFDPRSGGAVDVPDPYYGDEADFESCLDLVESGCQGLARYLIDRA